MRLLKRFLHSSCHNATNLSLRSWRIRRMHLGWGASQCRSKLSNSSPLLVKSTTNSRRPRRRCLQGREIFTLRLKSKRWTPSSSCPTIFLRKLCQILVRKVLRSIMSSSQPSSTWNSSCRCFHLSKLAEWDSCQLSKNPWCALLSRQTSKWIIEVFNERNWTVDINLKINSDFTC